MHAGQRILIRVDLPAPLSPSRQSTWPALTVMVMSFSATTEPKNLLTCRATSMRGCISHQRDSVTFLRMKLLNSTAMRSMAPRNTLNQSVLTPVKKMPICTVPKMIAPNMAPIAEP